MTFPAGDDVVVKACTGDDAEALAESQLAVLKHLALHAKGAAPGGNQTVVRPARDVDGSVDGSRHRRGCHVDIPWRPVAADRRAVGSRSGAAPPLKSLVITPCRTLDGKPAAAMAMGFVTGEAANLLLKRGEVGEDTVFRALGAALARVHAAPPAEGFYDVREGGYVERYVGRPSGIETRKNRRRSFLRRWSSRWIATPPRGATRIFRGARRGYSEGAAADRGRRSRGRAH